MTHIEYFFIRTIDLAKLSILFISLFCFGLQPLLAQLSFSTYNTSNGLGHNYVYGVHYADGVIYAATHGGLSISTDGEKTFANRTSADGLADNTAQGGVYVSGKNVFTGTATTEGFAVSTDGGASFTTYSSTKGNCVLSGGVTAMFGAGNKMHLASGVNGVYRSSDATNPSSYALGFTKANGKIPNNWVYGIYPKGNNLYFATKGGLAISKDNGQTFSVKTDANGITGTVVKSVFVADGKIYTGTDGKGLAISTDGGNTFTVKTTADGLGHNQIYRIYVSGKSVFVTTHGGFSISKDGGNSFTNYTTKEGLGSNVVKGLFVTKENIYLGTDGGVSIVARPSASGSATCDQFINPTFVTYSTDNGLGHKYVYGVHYSDGVIYAATHGGLSISTDGGNTFANRTSADGLADNTAQGGVYVSGKNVFTGTATTEGFAVSTDGGASFTTYSSTKGDCVLSGGVTAIFGAGNKMHLASGVNGVYRANDATNPGSYALDFTKSNGKLPSNWVYDIYAAGNNLYFATKGGLAISKDNGQNFSVKTDANGITQ